MTRDEAIAHIRAYARRHAMPELDAAALMLAVAVTTIQVADVQLRDDGELDRVDAEVGADPSKAH
jgi:hypothetical protein